MKYIDFGNTGLRPSKLGLGCSHLASLSSRHSPREICRTLHEATNQGINFFDTADVYGQGDSERLLGRELNNIRDNVILCTKVGMTVSASQSLIRLAKPVLRPLLRHSNSGRSRVVNERQNRQGGYFEADYIAAAVEKSLKRLRTDYLDILLLHNPPIEVLEDCALLDTLAKIKSSGKVRFIGLSCRSAEDASICLKSDTLDAVQLEANASLPAALQLLPDFANKGTGIISREVLAGGRLLSHPDIERIARQLGNIPHASLALQLMTQRNDSGVVLTGMTKLEHLQANIQALKAPPLPPNLTKSSHPLNFET